MIANTPMDTDKIKIYGARVKVDSLTSVQEIEVLMMWCFLGRSWWYSGRRKGENEG